MYDYYLGGDHNFEVDRAEAERVIAIVPEARDAAWATRGFLQRATRWLAEAGIRQFLDIGAGLPTQNNTHQVAQKVAADARVVYVDNDPEVVEYGAELLGSGGMTRFLAGDLRDPSGVLGHPRVRDFIDFDRPVGVLVVSVVHWVEDGDDPWGCVASFMDAVPSGSYLALSHATADRQIERKVFAAPGFNHRSEAEVARFFTGLEIVPPYEGAAPAVTYAGLWGAEDVGLADSDGSRWLYCAVARKA